VKENAHEVAKGGVVGALGGFILGVIFPAGVIAATVVGGAAGAGIGGLTSRHREHEIKKELGDVLPPDSSGIVAIFDEVWVAQVEKALAKAEKIDKEQVDRESVEKAKEAASAAS
jgi:uncharacterized membrane protein